MTTNTYVTILTCYGPLTVHRGWLRGRSAIAQAYTRTRNRT